MPFACIFVPDFSVEALLRAEPELRSQAVAVLEGKAPLQKVFAGNEKARRAGVEVGMTKLHFRTWTRSQRRRGFQSRYGHTGGPRLFWHNRDSFGKRS